MNPIAEYAAELRRTAPPAAQPTATTAQRPPCSVCDRMGYYVPDVAPGHPKFGRAIACPYCGREQYADLFLNRSGLSSAEAAYTLDWLPTRRTYPHAVQVVQDAVTNRAGIVALFGGFGVGKSGLLRAAVATTCRAGVRANYLTSSSFLDQVRATFSNNSAESAEAVVLRYASVRMLAIDEFDRIAGTEWAITAIGDLFDRRYRRRHELATLIASNTIATGREGIVALPESMGYIRDRLNDAECVLMLGDTQRMAGRWA